MSRKIKNIITSCILIVLIGISILTMYFAGQSIKTTTNTFEMGNSMGQVGNPPDMTNSDSSSTDDNATVEQESNKRENSSDSERRGTPPEKPSGEMEEGDSNRPTPPDNTRDGNSEMTPPEKRDSDTTSEDSSSEEGERPEMPSENGGERTPPDGNMRESMALGETNSSLRIWYYVAFGVEALAISIILMHWILSGFHKKTLKETYQDKDKIVILALATALITTGLTYVDGILAKNVFKSNSAYTVEEQGSVEASGSTTVTSKKALSSNYVSENSDESAILVKDGGNATIQNATITKSGDSTNTENSEFYGVNAGILVQKGSTATIKDSKITTSAKGSNAVFSTGEDSKIHISDSTIETTGSSSARGLDATYGGYIEADNVTITTQGGSCATLATDRGEGTVIANNSNLTTNGSGSPVIYSTGTISIDNTKGTANGSQMVVIEGKNSATVTNSTLSASGKGNRGTVDQAGIMIYQSMSGDASEGTGTFTATDSTLSIQEDSDNYQTAPFFFITNTDAVINLENNTLQYGSNILLSIKGTDEWGTSGKNGGNGILTAKKQSLEGDIEVDNISTLTFNLTNKSSYKGTINKENTAKEIKVTLDKNSTLTLTGDSYITSLEDEDETYANINFNGYTLYVNGVAVR